MIFDAGTAPDFGSIEAGQDGALIKTFKVV